jgi:glycosyltransferase involved in cell wall biosynthesis
MKMVYYEPSWYIRALDGVLIQHPPTGYGFAIRKGWWQGVAERGRGNPIVHYLHEAASLLGPVELARSWVGRFQPPPPGVSLTYSAFHLVFRREPWVLEIPCEQPHLIVGRETHFYTWKPILRRLLESSYCKAIVCRAEAVKEALVQRLGESNGIGDKLWVIYGGSPAKTLNERPPHGDRIRLLFVNSIHLNFPETFFGKGGLVLLEAFRRLLPRYPNIELVLRSKVPREIFRDYADILQSVQVLQDPLSQQHLEKLWMWADVFVLPSYVTPDAVLIEAMSYALPVVTTDVWANPEIVSVGRTGFLISSPHLHRFTDGHVIRTEHPDWGKHIRTLDFRMVDELEEKLAILIEREDLRRKMGMAARCEVEQGRFSIQRRNEQLKMVFDEATGL